MGKIRSTGSYLPTYGADAVAQQKAAHALISNWTAMAVVVHRADADDLPELVVVADYVSPEDGIVDESSDGVCGTCYRPLRECKDCERVKAD